MIQSISSSKVTKTNNYANLKSKAATQISFTGINASKVGREIIGNTGSKAEKKIAGLAEEAFGSVKRAFRKLKGKDELPYSEKPVTCNMQTNEKMQQELEEEARKRTVVKFRKEENEQKIKDTGNSVSPGDIDTSGYLTTSGQHKLDNPTSAHRHHEDFDDNSNDRLSFRGNSYDKVREEMERIQKSPWLSNKEKSEELIKLSGHKMDAGDIDQYGHLTTMGQHKVDSPSPIHSPEDRTTFRGDEPVNTADEIKKIQNSPWLSDEEKAKEIAEMKHPAEQADVNTDDAINTTAHHTPPADGNITQSEPPHEQHGSFLKRFFDSITGNGDDNIDT